MSHTLPPWTQSKKLDHDDGYRTIYSRHTDQPVIALVSPKFDDDEAEANARLITAAPELLDALRSIVMNAQFVPDAQMGNITDCYAVPLGDIEDARAAIAKATEQKK